MDNEEIVLINDVEYHFKLKSESIVALEKIYGKNIFSIFEDMSFTTIRTILSHCLISPKVADANELMDTLLTKYTLLEMPTILLKNIAVKSGLLKKEDAEETEIDGDLKNV